MNKSIHKIGQKICKFVLDKMVDPIYEWLDDRSGPDHQSLSETPNEQYRLIVEKIQSGRVEKIKIIDFNDQLEPDEILDLKDLVQYQIEGSFIIAYDIHQHERPLIRALCHEYDIYPTFVDDDDNDIWDIDDKPKKVIVNATPATARAIEGKFHLLMDNPDEMANYLADKPAISKNLTGLLLKLGVFNSVLVETDGVKVVWDRGLYDRDEVKGEGITFLLHEDYGKFGRNDDNWLGFKMPNKFWRQLKNALNDIPELK